MSGLLSRKANRSIWPCSQLKTRGIFIVAMLAANPTAAEVYTCKIVPEQQLTYLPDEITLEVTGDFGDVKVSDAMIAQTGRQWILAKIDTDNRKRITFVWTVKNLKPLPMEYRVVGRDPSLAVTLTVQKFDQSARISAIDITNFKPTIFTAKGQCTITGSP